MLSRVTGGSLQTACAIDSRLQQEEAQQGCTLEQGASARLSLCLNAGWLLAILKQFSVVSVNKATLFSARGMKMRF